MIDLPLKAKVECTDGHGGQSVTVIVERNSAHVTHLVVKEKKFPYTQRLVPVDLIGDIADTVIRLNCSLAELSAMETFIVDRYVQKEMRKYPSAYAAGESDPPNKLPPQIEKVKARQIPVGEVAVEPNMPVKATDGAIGNIDELLIDPDSGNVTHIVIRKGHFWDKKEVTLPVSMIDHTSNGVVHLKFDQKTLVAQLSNSGNDSS